MIRIAETELRNICNIRIRQIDQLQIVTVHKSFFRNAVNSGQLFRLYIGGSDTVLKSASRFQALYYRILRAVFQFIDNTILAEIIVASVLRRITTGCSRLAHKTYSCQLRNRSKRPLSNSCRAARQIDTGQFRTMAKGVISDIFSVLFLRRVHCHTLQILTPIESIWLQFLHIVHDNIPDGCIRLKVTGSCIIYRRDRYGIIARIYRCLFRIFLRRLGEQFAPNALNTGRQFNIKRCP